MGRIRVSSFSNLNLEERAKLIQMVRRAIADEEPLGARVLSLWLRNYLHWLDLSSESEAFLRHGVGFAAIDIESGDPLGMSMAQHLKHAFQAGHPVLQEVERSGINPESTAYLFNLVTATDHRNKKIGTILDRVRRDYAKQHGLSDAVVTTHPTNEARRAMLEKEKARFLSTHLINGRLHCIYTHPL